MIGSIFVQWNEMCFFIVLKQEIISEEVGTQDNK